MGTPESDVRRDAVATECKECYLYDPAEDPHEIKVRLSHRRQPAKDVVSGNDDYYDKMGGTQAGLGDDLLLT
ncbi:hypothetical protein SDC9_194471 [bioreactor metagenome]|uniref:Uncharacterized protein n=1 Tax=bioreactor metagenome TaxID=1076179 RepID=A0A645I7W4_9ZZZZ